MHMCIIFVMTSYMVSTYIEFVLLEYEELKLDWDLPFQDAWLTIDFMYVTCQNNLYFIKNGPVVSDLAQAVMS